MERCANGQFIPVEGDGYDAGFHKWGRLGPGVPLSAQPRPRVAVAKFDRHIRDLDADALERAQCLPHALDLLFAGFLLPTGLLEQFAEFAEACDGAPKLAPDH